MGPRERACAAQAQGWAKHSKKLKASEGGSRLQRASCTQPSLYPVGNGEPKGL